MPQHYVPVAPQPTLLPALTPQPVCPIAGDDAFGAGEAAEGGDAGIDDDWGLDDDDK